MHICFLPWLHGKGSFLPNYTWVHLLCVLISSFLVSDVLLALQGHHEMYCLSNVFSLGGFFRNISKISAVCSCSLLEMGKLLWGSLKTILGIKRVLSRSSITESVVSLIVLERKECTLLLNLFREFGDKWRFDIVHVRKFI